MALLWATGFELQSTTVGMEWRTTTSGAPAIETSIVHGGAAALRINGVAASDAIGHIVASAQGVRFYRTYFYLVAGSTGDNFTWTQVANSANAKVSFRFRSAVNGNDLQFYNAEDSAAIGASFTDINTGEWYRLEWTINSTTLSATTVEARLYAASDESTLLWNPSGTIDITADPNRWTIGENASDLTFDIIVDDVVCYDNSESYANTWAGEGKLFIMRPDGASAAAWTRGGTDSGANWSQCNNTPPDDVGSYVESNTDNQVDEYTLTATPAGMASDDVVNWIAPGARFALSSTASTDPDFAVGIKIGSDFDITGNLSGAGSTSYTSWQTTLGNIPALANNSNYEKPNSASGYTKSDLDSAIVRIEETVTDASLVRVSDVWVYVEHKPAGAPAAVIPPKIVLMNQALERANL